MKVTSIRELHRQKDGKVYWRVDLDGMTIPMLVFNKPEFVEGADIPEDSITLTGKEGNQYYAPKTEARKSYPKRSYGKTPEEIASIEVQVAVKLVAEIFVADKLDEFEKSTNPLAIGTRKWVKRKLLASDKSPLVEEAKKMGAVEQ